MRSKGRYVDQKAGIKKPKINHSELAKHLGNPERFLGSMRHSPELADGFIFFILLLALLITSHINRYFDKQGPVVGTYIHFFGARSTVRAIPNE